MILSILKGQRGGVAIAIAVGFMAFSLPLISGSLGLAQTTSVDARVKAEALQRDYCGLAVQAYVDYLLADTTRWANFLANNVDPNDPTKATATVDACGQDISLSVTQQPPDPNADPLEPPQLVVPNAPAYQQRDYQTYITVSETYPNGGDLVTYTITVINRSDEPVSLTKIQDLLPAGFTYDCTNPPDQLTLPAQAPQDVDTVISCPTGSVIEWQMPPGTTTNPGEEVTLVFNAIASTSTGTYCNEVEVAPGGDKTSSGQTARVEINAPTGTYVGQCPGEAVLISQTMDDARLLWVDDSAIPFIYHSEVDYTIKVENIGTEELRLSGFIDMLPVGYTYDLVLPGGTIPNAPFKLFQIPTLDRQEVTWTFNPDIVMAPGAVETLLFTANASTGQGNYWVDLLVEFGQGVFSEKVYTWPTAIVSVLDVYDVVATDENGNEYVVALQVQVQGTEGLIASWNIN